MKLSEFDFDLPSEHIAQKPCKDRSSSRLFFYDRKRQSIEHKKFTDILDVFGPNDVLVMNDSRVIPARIAFGKKEILLIKQIQNTSENTWECMVRGGKFFTPDRILKFDDHTTAIVKKVKEDGRRHIAFSTLDFDTFLKKYGKMPTPPYIQKKLKASEQYQTVYAKKKGSVAAPTAGFHFTQNILKKLKKKGVQIEFVTLHVGPGTFLPVKTENVEDHHMHSEYLELNDQVAERLNIAKKAGKKITAVGSTSLRTLESCLGIDSNQSLTAQTKKTNLFLSPPAKFHFVDHLLTNFHLPKSTLIMLVAAFLDPEGTSGVQKAQKLYQEAIKGKYRFYSFGDAMLIW